jgi:hypothetical protein
MAILKGFPHSSGITGYGSSGGGWSGPPSMPTNVKVKEHAPDEMTVDNFWLFKKRDREKDELPAKKPFVARGRGRLFDPSVIKKKIMTKPLKGSP